MSVLRILTRSWMVGMTASSLSTVAEMVASSASFWAFWPSSAAIFALCSRDLRHQKLALHGDERRVGGGRRMEGGERIVGIGERRMQARDIELRGLQVALQMIGLAFVDGGVELDQHIAGIDVLAVRDPDGAHDAGLEGLDHLAVAGRNDLAGGGGHDIHVAQACPGQAPARTAR